MESPEFWVVSSEDGEDVPWPVADSGFLLGVFCGPTQNYAKIPQQNNEIKEKLFRLVGTGRVSYLAQVEFQFSTANCRVYSDRTQKPPLIAVSAVAFVSHRRQDDRWWLPTKLKLYLRRTGSTTGRGAPKPRSTIAGVKTKGKLECMSGILSI